MSDELRAAAKRWSPALLGISDGDNNWAITDDDYDAAVSIARAYLADLHVKAAAKTLLKSIDDSDANEGCGDRTDIENQAIDQLRKLIEHPADKSTSMKLPSQSPPRGVLDGRPIKEGK